jgi:RNA polymerase sigma-70 factor (ECF subfamily)
MIVLCIVRLYERQVVSEKDFRALIKNHSMQVMNTALRILGDTQRAQDVHQEVFLAIWKRWYTYNGRTNWNAYLFRFTIRKEIELVRKTAFEQLRLYRPEDSISKETPDGPLRTEELQQKLADCLTKLPKRQAEVFILSRMEGLRTEKISDILGCSKKTVRVHLHRAVKRLARELSDYLI